MARFDILPRTLTAWRLKNDDSYYAAQKANIGTEFAGYDAPKLKFLFTVSFELGPSLTGNAVDKGSDLMSQVRYACKSATRPNVNINYNEVNSYNYRYKVATRADYGTVSVVFYDDNKNTAHMLLQRYLELVSPVSNQTREDYRLGDAPIRNWSSIGPMFDEEADGPIRSMRVTHHYNSGYLDDEGYHARVHYDYINPKIQSFSWDDLDMSVSDAAMISMTMVYDSVNITIEHNQGNAFRDREGNVIVNNGNTDDGDAVDVIRG